MNWTEDEVNILHKVYSDHSNKYLSNNIFNGDNYRNRSVKSISMKAKREDLEKDYNCQAMESIREVDEKEFKDDEFAHFICGFVAGEGSFTTTQNEGRTRYSFSIGMSEVDSDILYEIESFFGVGNVYESESRNNNWRDYTTYAVQSIGEIYNVIIPFFDKYGFRSTHKEEQYQEWKKNFIEEYDL